jgi:transglutaminase-like putative cysteine protease
MKRWLILLFILFLIPSVSAQIENYNNYTELIIDLEISSGLEKTGGELEYIQSAINFYPKEYYNQEIISQTYDLNPEATISENENELIFNWDQQSGSYTYKINSQIKTTNTLLEIKNKPLYPPQIDDDITIYTLPSEFIDITPEISAIAEELTGGEDDIYKISFILADWTQNNIEYNLTTLTSDAVFPSSWVLQQRQGVCDELTNLYISLLRSRGISARFVSGLVYSNIDYKFGAHGWAEVYIGDQWVPVDVTFGTFGWVDPGHIKFKETVDSGESSVHYEWLGEEVNINPQEIEFTTTIVETRGKFPDIIEIEIEALENKVGPESHVPIQITLNNPKNYYVPLKVSITKAPEVLENNFKAILLEPNSQGTLFWTIVIPSETEAGYSYGTTVEVMTMTGQTKQTEITYATNYDTISPQQAAAMIADLTIDDESEYLEEVELECNLDKEIYYTTDKATITCAINGEIEDTQVCFKEECQQAKEIITWKIDLASYNSQRILITASKEERMRTQFLDLYVIGETAITIKNLEPKTLGFKEEKNLVFEVHTKIPLKDIKIKIEKQGTLSIKELEGFTTITMPIKGKQYFDGDIKIDFFYNDELGKEYSFTTKENIDITNIPWFYRLLLSIQKIF